MAISLNWVLAAIICVVVLSVAGATLGITMAVSLDALTSVGSERALSLTTDVSDLSSAYLNVLAFDATSTRDVATMLGALPSDLAARGTNWTALYGSSMFTSLSDSNFTLFRSKIIFDDGNWMHLLSRCAVRTGSTCTAWWEKIAPATTWTIGGRSISRDTFTDDTVGGAPEEAGFPINPDPWTNAQAAAIRTSTNRGRSCAWEGVKFYHTAATGGMWILTAGCNLVNSSGVYLGRVQYEAFVDRDLDEFLNTVERSPNSVLFIIDSDLRVIATTQNTLHYKVTDATLATAVPEGCSLNTDSDLRGSNTKLGCLLKSSDFPFKPLQVQSASFLNTSGKSLQTVSIDHENYYAVSERIHSNLAGFSFNVVLFSPESDVIGDVERGRNIAIGVTAGVFVIGAAAAMFVTARLLQALTTVSEKLYKMAKLDDEGRSNEEIDNTNQNTTTNNTKNNNNNANNHGARDNSYIPSHEMSEMDREQSALSRDRSGASAGDLVGQEQSGLHNNIAAAAAANNNGGDLQLQPENQSVVSEFAALQNAYFAMNTAMKSFTKYVPKDVVRELMAKKELCTINMKPLPCTMLFCDISNFTAICERVDPSSISGLVKLYFERMSGLISFHDGIIDKFIGDQIMSLWGAPSAIDHQELRGCLCALSLQREARKDPLDRAFREIDEALHIRVGVAAGTVHAGNMGSDKRMSYTVIGDAVNLAARLESFNRQWYTNTMIPEDIAPLVSPYLVLRKLVFASIVGKDIPCDLFEIISVQPRLPDLNQLKNGSPFSPTTAGQNDDEEAPSPTANGVNGDFANQHKNGTPAPSSAAAKFKRTNLHPVSGLIQYHHRHGSATPQELRFVELFSRAADQLKYKQFAQCMQTLNELEQDGLITSPVWREHKSISKLREIAEQAQGFGDAIPAENLWENGKYFVYRASEK